jgi:SAM-dependent methyltransferase
LKRLIHKFFNAFGYDIRRLPKEAGIPASINENQETDISISPKENDLYSKIFPEESLRSKRFYNIGAGGFEHRYWTNVDLDSEWYAFNREKTLKGIQYDLLSLAPLPIESGSAEVVYSSHTIEHINNPAAQNMFNESFRILKTNGYLRVSSPNIDLAYRALRDNNRHYFAMIEQFSNPEEYKRARYNMPLKAASTEQVLLITFATSASTIFIDGAPERIDDDKLNALFKKLDYEEALDYCISRCPLEIQKQYPGNHINWWNFKKMANMLEKAGFHKIYLSGFKQSFCPILKDVTQFDNTWPEMSLYVEAIK